MPQVSEILQTMEYGPAPEASDHVRAWLDGHAAGFRHYIDGVFQPSAERTEFP